ncbi:hypothetical protein QSV34_12985 [Porticoccus sp. W117]|uniref:hypothetical protein n=1 Tax=Porticoccus sp. W117 TaxID=3054777 RepID=UPI0025989BDE|nr:hypothetical protein [Porticoccus sp. W117]MDM3872263.1 hypothetical protein [Porticoccus sp. W117]
MKKITYIATSIAAALSLAGCTNAITYHHSERNSIALESKQTDPQQPIQGVIGVKTRTVVVTPALGEADKDNSNSNADVNPGESASVIHDFSLEREPGGFLKFGKTIIQSAFITGDAATIAPPASAAALGGWATAKVGSDESTTRKLILGEIYIHLQTLDAQKDKVATEHLKRLDSLSKLLPDISGNKYYQESPADNLSDSVTVPTFTNDFQGVINHLSFLQGRIADIKKMEDNRKFTFNGNEINVATLKGILDDKKRIQGEIDEFEKIIGSSAVIDRAALYVIKDI